jgi:hypothetical protein
MVYASTLFAAAFVIVPVLAAPLNVEQVDESFTRSAEDNSDLELRDPRFSFGRVFRGIGRVAKTVGRVAAPAASLLLRDEEGNIYVRDLESDLELRDPKFSFGRVFRGIGRVAKTVGRVAAPAASLLLRDEDGTVYVRDLDFDELAERDLDFDDLTERDFTDGEDFDIRDPRFRFGSVIRKATGIARKVTGVAGNVANAASSLGFRELEDDELDARDFVDIEDYLERDLEDSDDLEARKLGSLLKTAVGVARKAGGAARKAGGVARKAGGVASKVSGAARKAGGVARKAGGVASKASGAARKAGGVARKASGAARKAGGVARKAGGVARKAGGVVRKAGGIAERVAGVAGTVSDIASSFGFRDLEEEEMEARTIDDLD